MSAVDVLAVMDRADSHYAGWDISAADKAVLDDLNEARAAVAELIAADHALDVSRETLTHVNNLVAAGSRSDDDFRRQANADHAYARAVDRRARALARCKGETA